MKRGDEDVRRVRPFADILLELDRGRVHDEASIGIRDLVEQVLATGKNGSVTVKLDIKPESDEMVKVEATVTSKVPKAKPKTSVFFVTDDMNLSRHNPAQERLPLREVPADADNRDGKSRAAGDNS